ncbi:MAG: 2-hydroxyacid dehydrogenase [Pseudomonadota bacterium]
MTDILIMSPMLPSVHAALEESFTVHKLFEAEDKEMFLLGIGGKVKGVATSGHIGCPPEVMNKLPNLEMIASFGVGYDAIDTADCRARGITVTNTPDVLTDAMAEITVGLMIALCRKIPQTDAYVRAGKWHTVGHYALTGELTGKRLGILGLGRIGKEVARRAQAFKMEVVYHGRSRQADQPYPYFASLEEMARDVEWLVVIAPGTPETKGIVSRQVLEALGPEGHLVNVARGGLVDQEALVEMLAKKAIAGAALDVFADEPQVPEALWGLDNVVLSPHQGSATTKTRTAMGDLVVRNLAAHFAGDPLLTPVA